MRTRYNLITMAAVLAAASTGVGTQQPTFRAEVTVVEMAVTVVDDSGSPRTDLRAADFVVLEDGKAQEIDTFGFIDSRSSSSTGTLETASLLRGVATNSGSANAPLFVLLFDDLQISSRYTAAAQRIGRGLVDGLPTSVQLAVATTSGYANTLLTFAEPGDAQREQIERVRGQALDGTSPEGPGGVGSVGPMRDPKDCGPYCVDPNRAARRLHVLEQVGSILQRAGSRRKVLFWVTEALGYTPVDLEEGRAAQRAALRSLLNADVAVYPVDPRELRANAPSNWFSRDELEAAVPLKEFAAATGGQLFENRNQVQLAVVRAARQHLFTYLLSYRPTAPEGGNARRVDLLLPRHLNLTVRARTRYTPRALSGEASAADAAASLESLIYSPVSGGTLPLTMRLVGLPASGGRGLALVTLEGPPRGVLNQPVDIAFTTVDSEGRMGEIVTGRVGAPEPPWLVSRIVDLPPGLHQVRVAARSIDHSKAGVVVSEVQIPEWVEGRLFLSDIMLAKESADPRVLEAQPILDSSVAARAPVVIQAEAAGEDLEKLSVSAEFEHDGGPGWQTMAALSPGVSTSSKRATVVVPASVVTPGTLVVTLRATSPGLRAVERRLEVVVRE